MTVRQCLWPPVRFFESPAPMSAAPLHSPRSVERRCLKQPTADPMQQLSGMDAGFLYMETATAFSIR